MADILIGVVFEALLTKVISLANEQITAVLGVEEDLRKLHEQLELIQALLYDAHSKSTTNKTTEVWLGKLEVVATDADDLLDEFAYQVLSKNMKGDKDKVRNFISSLIPLGFSSNMVSKIKKIKLQIDEIFEEANRIGLRPADISNSPNDPRVVLLTDPFVDDSKVVGRGDDMSEIVSLLTCSKDEKNLSVIGIVGMGGQGKTTLAKLLMKNVQVKMHFEKTIWTCVSDDFDVDRVLKDMFEYLTEETTQLTNRVAVVKRLSKELQGKRFLLVLDDVWDKDNKDGPKLGDLWDIMKNSLQEMGGSNGSRIIVTTRDKGVVTVMNGFIYELGVLSGKASQELFEKIAFGAGTEAKTPQLEKIGKRIVARCGGVPLALKAIGGLLSSKRNEHEWLRIEESDAWRTLDGVHSALKLSFDHLPSLSLKQCFIYCSVFPKDSNITKNVTIQQWMAHGWLNPSSGSGLEMEDIGNNYFKILLQRSLLQEAECDEYGNIVSCKMHDLVHDFALRTSKGRCLTAKVKDLSDDIKAIHLTIVPDKSNIKNLSKEKISRLRTFFSRLRTLHLPEGFFDENFFAHCNCDHLRVLTLTGQETKILPISIANMKHLRYLDTSGTFIKALPKFVSKFYNLQTLRLHHGAYSLKDFVRLVNLRHLYTTNSSCFGKRLPPLVPGIGHLTSLRTLNSFGVSRDKGCQIDELHGLNFLEGSLSIIGLENVANGDDARRADLSRKRNIESLKLFWNSDNATGSNNVESVLEGLQLHVCLKSLRIYCFMGRSLPSWIQQLDNLISVKLEYLEKCEQIPPVGHLPLLKVLKIKGMSSIRCIGNDFYGWPNPNVVSADSSQTSAAIFRSLKEFQLINMSSLEEWLGVSSSSSIELFPCLERFYIERCPQLTHLPGGLLSASIVLEILHVQKCDKLVSFPDLSIYCSLKKLFILGCPFLTCLPKDLSSASIVALESLVIDECVKLVSIPDLSSCHSLTQLRILKCPELLGLPRGIEACRSLQNLTITWPASVMESFLCSLINMRELSTLIMTLSNDIIVGYVPTEPISSATEDDIRGRDDPYSTLKRLHLSAIAQIESLPEQIQRFTALRTLSLVNFKDLETLPEWLGNFRSLEFVLLCKCSSLANFPSVGVMQGLTNLRKLEIWDCPILEQRCERENGAEWHKIAHIPKIQIL